MSLCASQPSAMARAGPSEEKACPLRQLHHQLCICRPRNMPRFSLGCCDRCHGLLFEHPVIFWTRRGAPAPGSISNSSGWQYSASASGPKCFAEIAWRPRSQFWIAVKVTPTALASWRCVRPRQRRTSASRAPIFASMSASMGTLTTHSLPASASMRRGDETRKRFSARWESAWG